MADKRSWIVFGARDKGDKSLLAYYDTKASMFAIKILQQYDDCQREFGVNANVDYGTLYNEIEGEYTTLYFAKKNGIKSIDSFIDILEQVKRWMEAEELKDGNNDKD